MPGRCVAPVSAGDEGTITATPGQPSWLVSGISGHDLSNSQADSLRNRVSGRRHAGGSAGVFPPTCRRSIHDSRNLSRAPPSQRRFRRCRDDRFATLGPATTPQGFGGYEEGRLTTIRLGLKVQAEPRAGTAARVAARVRAEAAG